MHEIPDTPRGSDDANQTITGSRRARNTTSRQRTGGGLVHKGGIGLQYG